MLEEARAWQDRALDPVWAVVFLDAIVVKVRDNHVVHNKPAYLAAGVDGDGEKHVLGIWLAKTALEDAPAGEGARFWASVDDRPAQPRRDRHPDRLLRRAGRVRGRHPRGVPRRHGAALRRASHSTACGRLRAATPPRSPGLRAIYTAPRGDVALDALAAFSASPLGQKYPRAVKVWEDAWDCFTPFLAFSPSVRKLLYTTNSIESLNYQLRKVTKARGHFPGDDAVVKLLWLAIINIEDKRARERARAAGHGKRSTACSPCLSECAGRITACPASPPSSAS